MDQYLKEENKSERLDEQFYEMFKNQNLEVASVEDRDDPNAKRINKQAFQEQTFHKIKQKEIATQIKDLEWDNRYEWLSYMKMKANDLVRKQEFDKAIQIYMETAVGLDLCQKDQEVKKPLQKKYIIMKTEFQVIILSNLAICYKKKKDFDKAIKFHNLAVNCDPTSGVQIMKRAYTYYDMGEVELAQKDIPKCRKILEQYPNQQLFQDIKVLIQKLDQHKSKQLKTYQKMFDPKKDVEIKNDKQDNLSKQQTLYDQYDEQDEVYDKVIKNPKRFWRYYGSFVGFLKKIFGCKRIYDDEQEDIDNNEDQINFQDQVQNFLI